MPRQKALQFGIVSLSEDELLALVLKSAGPKRNVFQLVEEVIEKANGFQNLPSLSYEELSSINGIKEAKALELMAILEIAKRLSRVERIAQAELNSPGKVVEWLRFNLGFSLQEEFFVIYLDSRNAVLKSEIMYRGNRNTASIGIDEIMRRAILIRACFLLVAHNHPSDNVTPSKADIELTEKLSSAGRLLSIPLIDHIIVGKSSYFSFKNHSMLE